MVDMLNSWKWKEEPVSPSGLLDLEAEVAEWGLFEDDQVQKPKAPPKQETSVPLSRAEVASQLLEHLDEWIKEASQPGNAQSPATTSTSNASVWHQGIVKTSEPFADWLEQKIDLPIFEELPVLENQGYSHGYRGTTETSKLLPAAEILPLVVAPAAVPVPVPVPAPAPVPTQVVNHVMVAQDTQSLLQEFETVFGAVELNHCTLTPPQSPPVVTYGNMVPQESDEPRIITTLQQISPVAPVPIVKPSDPLVPITYVSEQKLSIHPDMIQELAAVEELLRTRCEDLVDHSDPWETNSNSPNMSSSGTESETEVAAVAPPSPCTSSNSSYGSSEEDPEWVPVAEQHVSPGCQKSGRKRSSSGKPYSRPGVEEKRIRKKEQNKNAATRYRQKKKAEIEEILSEEKGLEDRNTELQTKVSDLMREIKYLKGLMRDVFKAKGLIK